MAWAVGTQLSMYIWQFTVHNAQLTIHSSQCTVDHSQFTIHSAQFTVHNGHSQPQNEQIECKILWEIATERNAEENMRKPKCRIIKKVGKVKLGFQWNFHLTNCKQKGFASNCNSAWGVHCETVKGLLVQANDDFFFEKRSKSWSADKVQQRAKGFSGLQCSGSLANQCAGLHDSVTVLQC